MAIYRNVQMSFWTDRKIEEDFTPADKYMYLFLMTNPLTNLCGCYEIGFKQIAHMTGYDVKKVKAIIERLQSEHKVISYSNGEVLLLNWHKFNWTTSEKFRNPLLIEIQNIKNEGFKEYLKAVYNGLDTVSIPYQSGIDTTDAVTVTVTEHIPIKTKNKDFIRPTVEQVREYADKAGLNLDAERFVDYYTANGWKVGGRTPMKDWQAAARNWARRDKPKTSKGFDYENQRNYTADDYAALERRLLAR